MIVTAISTMSVTLGATLAFAASGFPRHQAVLETFAGWLMIGGLGLLGYAIGCVIGQP